VSAAGAQALSLLAMAVPAETTLYSISSSHPAYAAHLMLAHKRLDHRVIDLVPGLHAPVLRALGFRQGTVPALLLGGRRVQGSLQISRALEDARLEPRLFPEEPGARLRVEEAERWAEATLQPLPRRLFRWLMTRRREARVLMMRQAGVPAPGLAGTFSLPVARAYARAADATDGAEIAAMVRSLPGLLAHVDALLDGGTIGGAEPNAADFQIASTIRVLLSIEDLAPVLADHRAAAYAGEMLPASPFAVPVGFVPPEWLRSPEGVGRMIPVGRG